MIKERCAYWCLTINEGASCFNNIQTILDSLVIENPNFEYYYIYHNSDDETKNYHCHLVLYFKGKVKRFTTIETLFSGAHIEQTNQQRFKRAIQYLIHKNDPDKEQYKQCDIVSNVEASYLADILNGSGYDFEYFDESKINDYMIEFYQKNGDINAGLFVDRFGLSAISKYYFIIKDMCKDYSKLIVNASMRFHNMSNLDKAFLKYIKSDIDLKQEWKMACFYLGFNGDYDEYKNNIYMDFVDSVERGDIDINNLLKGD